MLTLTPHVAPVVSFAASPVRVPVAAPTTPLFARFLTALLRALGAMHT
jgi:hypothetical protein